MANDTPLVKITEGWTNTLGPFTLKVNGVPLPLNGKTVELKLRRASGDVVTPAGTLTPDPDQVTNPGQVSYTPDSADFTWEPLQYRVTQDYRLHFKVTDGAGRVVYFPNDEAAVVQVSRA